MTLSDEQIISDIIAREGGGKYTDNPADRGGPTRFGITQQTLSEWRGHPVDGEAVAHLEEAEARAIYRQRYILDPGFFKIKDGRLRALLIDSGVNHGPKQATRFLQRALRVEDDGIFGNDTFLALVGSDEALLYRRVVVERLKFYGRLVSKDLSDKDKDGVPDNVEFISGWLNRLAEFIEVA